MLDFLIKKKFDEDLESYHTSETYFELDLQSPKLKTEPVLLVQIEAINSGPNTRSKYLILRRTNSNDEELEKRLLSNSTDPEYWIALGEECKREQLFFNALHAYNKALRFSPHTHTNRFFDFVKVYFKPNLEVLVCLETEK